MASSVHERSVMDVFKPDFSKGFDSLLLDCRFFFILFYIYIYIILLSNYFFLEKNWWNKDNWNIKQVKNCLAKQMVISHMKSSLQEVE